MREGRYEEARVLLERALDESPGSPELHSNLGSLWHIAGDLERALAAHRRAISLCECGAPANVSAIESEDAPEEQQREQRAWLHYNLGVVAAALGRFAEAVEAYESALRWQPELLPAVENLGTVWQLQGDYQQAVRLYRQLLARDPGRASGYRNLGSALCALGQLELARDAYQRASALAPSDPAVWLDLAAVEHARADIEAAIDSYRRACELAPTDPGAHIGHGRALLAAGRLAAAEEAHRRALALAPESAATHNALGATLVAHGDHLRALEHLRRALALSPDWPLVHYNLGVALQHSRELRPAVDAYRAALELAAHTPGAVDAASAWYNLAECLRMLDDHEHAADAYRQLLALEPGHVSAGFLSAALAGDELDTAPTEYVRRLFDDYAPRFDAHLQDSLDYRMPAAVRAAITGLAGGSLSGDRSIGAALDLGCGTGLVGVELRPYCALLHGVDISPEMLKRAEQRGVYDQLFCAEVRAWLGEHGKDRYQLITAADVLIYIGVLDELFELVTARLDGAGVFAFTIEKLGASDRTGGDFALQPTGRYCHSRAYIARLAERHRLRVDRAETVTLRTEHDQPVTGVLYVLGQ